MNYYLGLFISAAIGYISLSEEILWVRVLSFATGSEPKVFAYVLGAFLFGIFLGAIAGKKISESQNVNPIRCLSVAISISAVLYFLALPLTCFSVTRLGLAGLTSTYLMIIAIAAMNGAVLPVISHLCIDRVENIGLPFSSIYFANIIGSALGPLVTGFYLLDSFTVESLYLFLSLSLFIFLFILWIGADAPKGIKASFVLVLVSAGTFMIYVHPSLYDSVIEKLFYKKSYSSQRFKYVVQNKSGIITVEPGDKDTLFGNGAYDGAYNINPLTNENGIARAYAIPTLHPMPREVLQIGLGSGSWAKVLTMYPELQALDIVEINPGHIGLIHNYEENATIFSDPRVKIHVDDGRRWLRRNNEREFDLILMNTTQYWRNLATNVLSKEFLIICKKHLKPKGVMYYNATHSQDIPFTAAKVFKYVVRFLSFIAVSDSPFDMEDNRKLKNIMRFENAGSPMLLYDNPDHKKVYNSLINETSVYKPEDDKNKYPRVITDDNMANEFKLWHKVHIFNVKYGWKWLFSRIEVGQ
jgi:spermidine synthase